MSKISIIIPVYNAEKYLSKCLSSVVNQTLRDIEVIIINDGSTDNSLDICRKYEKTDKRIILIDTENNGVSIARNHGIKVATSDYIMFVDADDWIDLNMSEILYNKINENNYDICISNNIKDYGNKCEYIDFDSPREVIYLNEIKTKIILPLIEEKDKKTIHRRESFRGPCSKLYKREIILKNNVTFNPYLIIGEDLMFNIQYLSCCANVVFDISFLYHYRINSASVTRRYRTNIWQNYRDLLIILEEYLESSFRKRDYIKRINKLKIKYVIISISNEMNKNNIKSYSEKKNYIRNICEDTIVNDALRDYSKGAIGNRSKVVLFLLRHKIYWPFAFIKK